MEVVPRGNDLLLFVFVGNGNDKSFSTGFNYPARLPVKATVGHCFMHGRINLNIDKIPDLVFDKQAGQRTQTALPTLLS